MARRTYTVSNAHVKFHDFGGNKFGVGGSRNFTIELSEDEGKALEEDGFNVKWNDPDRWHDDIYPTIKVKIGIHDGDGLEFLNPAIWTVGNGAPRQVINPRNPITPAALNELSGIDGLDIESVDVTFTRYEWNKGGNRGVTAYAQSVLVKYNEDPVRAKVNSMADDSEEALPFT